MDPQKSSERLSGGAHETVESVAHLDRGAESKISSHQRWIERTTLAVGRPRAVYVVLAFTAA